MQYFYDGQIRRYLLQVVRLLSNILVKYQDGTLVRVPVMYGDMDRQVANIINQNSENNLNSAPRIAVYITGIELDRNRLGDSSYVGKVHIREREFELGDDGEKIYNSNQGENYTVERLMPTPYKMTLKVDIWSTSTEQKLQILEQLLTLFNPSLEIQTTDNYVDWTSLTVLQLKSTNWTSRQVPQGANQDIDILNLTFETPIWITPPAKVKRLGIITKIIANAFTNPEGTIVDEYDNVNSVYLGLGDPILKTVVTPGNFDLLVLNNIGNLIQSHTATDADAETMPDYAVNWRKVLDLYPGQFRANLSQIRLLKPDGNEIVAYISLDPFDERKMLLNFDVDTIPANTIIGSRGTVDAIINPETFNPGSPAAGTRYLILENINATTADGPAAWLNADSSDFSASANDIIEWTGSQWNIIFNSQEETSVTYITNIYTGIQYKWSNDSWSKSFEGLYEKAAWRIIL